MIIKNLSRVDKLCLNFMGDKIRKMSVLEEAVKEGAQNFEDRVSFAVLEGSGPSLEFNTSPEKWQAGEWLRIEGKFVGSSLKGVRGGTKAVIIFGPEDGVSSRPIAVYERESHQRLGPGNHDLRVRFWGNLAPGRRFDPVIQPKDTVYIANVSDQAGSTGIGPVSSFEIETIKASESVP